MAGLSASRRMPQRLWMPRAALPGKAAAAWTPASLTSLACWYDASDTATITQSGGFASQINDKSASGLHLVQATGANQPATNSTTVNSLNTLVFDGTDDDMHSTSGTFPTTSGGLTWAVCIKSNAGGGQGLIQIEGGTLDEPRTSWGSPDSANMSMNFAAIGGQQDYADSGSDSYKNITTVLAYRISTTDYQMWLYRSTGGSSVLHTGGLQSSSSSAISGKAPSLVRIGNNLNAERWLSGSWCEGFMSATNESDSTISTQIVPYLATKWAA